MDNDEILDPIIAVHLHCHTTNQEHAAKAIDTLSRIMLGLTLDGLDVSISATMIEDYEDEEEYEGIDGEDEAGN